MGEPDVAAEPAEPAQELDRPAAVALEAVALLVLRLREVGVQPHAVLASELGGAPHQVLADREGRAGREADARIARGRGSWYSRISRRESARIAASSWQMSSGGSPPPLGPRLIEPRVGWNRIPRSRAARISASMSRSLARGEEVEVVGRGGAPVSSSSPSPTQRRGLDGLRVEAAPDLVELGQPAEERRLLHARDAAGQHLGQVVVRVDEPGQDHLAARVDLRSASTSGGTGGAPTATTRSSSISTQPPGRRRAGVVHRGDEPRVVEQRAHAASSVPRPRRNYRTTARRRCCRASRSTGVSGTRGRWTRGAAARARLSRAAFSAAACQLRRSLKSSLLRSAGRPRRTMPRLPRFQDYYSRRAPASGRQGYRAAGSSTFAL